MLLGGISMVIFFGFLYCAGVVILFFADLLLRHQIRKIENETGGTGK